MKKIKKIKGVSRVIRVNEKAYKTLNSFIGRRAPMTYSDAILEMAKIYNA